MSDKIYERLIAAGAPVLSGDLKYSVDVSQGYARVRIIDDDTSYATAVDAVWSWQDEHTVDKMLAKLCIIAYTEMKKIESNRRFFAQWNGTHP